MQTTPICPQGAVSNPMVVARITTDQSEKKDKEFRLLG
jgi:hypothetical protein